MGIRSPVHVSPQASEPPAGEVCFERPAGVPGHLMKEHRAPLEAQGGPLLAIFTAAPAEPIKGLVHM